MRCPEILFLALVAGAAVSAAEPRELLAGRDLEGWQLIAPVTQATSFFTPLPQGVVAFTGQPVGFIETTACYSNYRLHAEWRWPKKPGNGGVLVHISSGPRDRAWPLSFQIQTKHGDAGDLLPMAGATFAEPLTSAPGAATAIKPHTAPDSEKPAGEWNTCDIVCRGDTIEVTINGMLQNSVTGCSLREGKIGFQLEGAPFELRAVSLVALD